MKRWVRSSILVVLSLLFVIGAAGCGASAASTQAAQETALPPVKAEANVESDAVVVPVNYVNLSFSGQGIVEEVLVAEGEQVHKDQIIARLKGSEQMQAELSKAKMQLVSAQQAVDDLYKNAEVARANAQLTVVKAQDTLDDAKEKRESKTFSRTDQETVDIARANYVIAEDGVTQAEIVYDRFDGLGEDDPMRANAFSQLAQARQTRDKALSNLNWLLGKPDAQEIALADANVEVARANLDLAQTNYEDVKDGKPDPEDLALAEANLDAARSGVDAAQAALDNLELKAPFAGAVIVNKLKVGEPYILGSSTPVALADLSDWRVETTDLTELNVMNIDREAPVKVIFDAIPDLELTGQILRIKSYGESRQGDITYTAVIQLDQLDERLMWNMSATVIFSR
ncbi:MAG: biotin/lipoyl-binding protein [Chloroflexi bacterium]|nr:biotin/lipoyl-binding protein [Anaerolineaceae bacterium]NMB88891.1 biotin/lipoyl-binding protein [Chloroflexota bacterium]